MPLFSAAPRAPLADPVFCRKKKSKIASNSILWTFNRWHQILFSSPPPRWLHCKTLPACVRAYIYMYTYHCNTLPACVREYICIHIHVYIYICICFIHAHYISKYIIYILYIYIIISALSIFPDIIFIFLIYVYKKIYICLVYLSIHLSKFMYT